MNRKPKKTMLIAIMLMSTVVMIAWASDGLERYALVIGNSNYQLMTKLPNPVNDATDIAAELTRYGFNVDLVTNASLGEMTQSVQRFVTNLEQSSRAEAALFYYEGHGVQFNGSNYLVPVNADIQASYELLDKTLGMDSVVRGLEQSQSNFNLIVLDACRDNPFSSTRSGDRGLSVMGTGGKGSMVVFATSPGNVAQDGDGRNSPFTEAFLNAMQIPGVEIRELITSVQRKVQDQTGGKQIPWVNMSYTGEFYFQTIEQQLERSQAELTGLQEELANLESEIQQREAAIQAAGSVEERRRLEALQATTKALEAAKQLEAQRAMEMERQAQEILDSQAAQNALQKEMETRLASQAEALNRQTEQRKAELEELKIQHAVADQSFQARLDTIVQYNKSISEIKNRYSQLIESSMKDLDSLHETKVMTFRNENPKDPWETKTEHEARLQETLVVFTQQHEELKAIQKKKLEDSLEGEITPLQNSLDAAKSELQGKRFEVTMENIKVDVGAFDAELKQFPITVYVDDGLVSFIQPLFYTITSREREVLKSEYYRVFSAAQSKALVGRAAYRVFEIKDGLWTVLPEYIEVLNLLEGDAVFSEAWKRDTCIITSPVASFRVDTSVLSVLFRGIQENVCILGIPKDATVAINGVTQPHSSGSLFIGRVGTSSVFSVDISSPWLPDCIQIQNSTTPAYGSIAFCDISDMIDLVGHLEIPRPELDISLFRSGGEAKEIPMEVSQAGYFAKLFPGKYIISGKVAEDRYDSFLTTLEVKAGERTFFDPGPVGFSLQYQYEESVKQQEVLRQAIKERSPKKDVAWSAMGVATAGVLGSVVSYMLYNAAIKNKSTFAVSW